MRVAVVVGMPGSGKGVFAGVTLEAGIPVVRMGDMVRMEAKKKGIELTDANVGALADSERKDRGADIWAKRTYRYIVDNSLDREDLLVDGVRSSAELDFYRNVFGENLVVVGIHAPPSVRYGRLIERDREDCPITYEDFKMRDERELKWGIGDALALSEHILANDAALSDFQERCRELLRSIFDVR